ncbi:MAG: hypothetical protein LBI01_04785 [Elusimicrobium sp.]|jgi:chromosome segregation ATPase|nr:hypothetical protein [Elusimicrobium sp.]
MDLESNENLPSDISHFLDQFEKENSELERAFTAGKMNFYTTLDPQDRVSAPKNTDKEKEQHYKKLEEKIVELEKKFENSIREKEILLNELSRTKNETEKDKGRDEFFNNIAMTIANLRDSVDRLNRAQGAPQRPVFMPQTEIYGQGYYYGAPIDQASKIGQEEIFKARQEVQKYSAELNRTKDEITARQTTIERQERELAARKEAEVRQVRELSAKQSVIDRQKEEIALQNQTIAAQKTEVTQQKIDKEEKERFIEGLKEKTLRLKAVNTALEKEFKRVQEDKMSALKKSAEQAKEILSLREQLTKAEEGFKSFDFEGRVISIKNQYQQKVSKLETQLQEVSAVCMRQVEEIENLKTERSYFRHFEEDAAALKSQLESKNKEIALLKAEVESVAKNSREVLLNISTSTSSQAQDIVNARLEAAKTAFKQVEAAASAKIKDAEIKAETKVKAVELKAEGIEKAAAARIKEISQKAGKMEQEAAERIKDITQKANDEIAALDARIIKLQNERDAISAHLKTVSAGAAEDAAAKSEMHDTFNSLKSKIKENDAVIEELKNKIKVLDGENKTLKKKTHTDYLEKKAAMEAVPAAVAPELSYPDPASRNARQSRAKAAALGKDFDGKKDFLEDTQTFFGRMKWSLLKDDD